METSIGPPRLRLLQPPVLRTSRLAAPDSRRFGASQHKIAIYVDESHYGAEGERRDERILVHAYFTPASHLKRGRECRRNSCKHSAGLSEIASPFILILKMNGRDDGARTRGLRRDRLRIRARRISDLPILSAA